MLGPFSDLRLETPSTALWAASATVALVPPTLLAFNLPPSATFFNQAASLIGWGLWLAVAAAPLMRSSRPGNGPRPALAAFALLLVAALASPIWSHLPWSLALSSAGLLAAASLALATASALQRTGRGAAAFAAFCIGLVVAGVCSSAIGIVQVFFPALADGDWIARSVLDGRAVGNLRQPNHLSSLLLWAIVAAVWLGQSGRLKARTSALLSLVFVFVTVLSASRTGAVGTLVLAAWGLADRRLAAPQRRLLLAMPLAYAAFWGGTTAWAHFGGHVFGGETRFSGGGDVSSSRFGIWSNTWSLIRAHPWAGVGFGEFNFAWTLTPFPGRPVAFFDHTHNLPLQFAVELGLPLATAVLALLGAALWRAFRRAWRPLRLPDDRASRDDDGVRRAAFTMVLMVCIHSLLEYPLWYAYFLLPAAFAFGLCLGDDLGGNVADDAVRSGSADAADAVPVRATTAVGRAGFRRGGWSLAGLLLAAGGVFSLYAYAQVVAIFAPAADAPPLPQRIEAGRRSVFFGHHADYAAATTVDHPSRVMAAFARAPHYLLDARLMMAWARALNEAGRVDQARYLAARLREFRNPQTKEFFAACEVPLPAAAAPPFQCVAPAAALGYADFR